MEISWFHISQCDQNSEVICFSGDIDAFKKTMTRNRKNKNKKLAFICFFFYYSQLSSTVESQDLYEIVSALRKRKWIIIKYYIKYQSVAFWINKSNMNFNSFFPIKTITNLPFIWCLPTFCCIISTQRNSWRIHDHTNSDFCRTITKSSIWLIFEWSIR